MSFSSLSDLSEALARGEVSSRELTLRYLERIAELDGRLGAFLHVDEAGALAAADASDRRRRAGAPASPLDGIPLAIKDNLHCVGMPTTAASRILEGYRPPFDATAVRRLRADGAVLLGKVNCDEFAMGSSNENSAFGPCRNPWDLSRTPGGSSGGSAASVAADLCAGALGTDTGGSIRQPAAFCGVVGLKPTYGRVSRHGVVAFASSLDQVGPLGRSVRDVAMLLGSMAGHDERDATSLPAAVPDYLSDLEEGAAGLRVGVPDALFDLEGLDPAVRQAMSDARAALQARGARIAPISLPHARHAISTYYVLACSEAASNLARYDGIRFGPRQGEEQGLRALYEQTRGQLFGNEVKRRIVLGNYLLSAGYYDAYYVRAQRVRRRIAEDFAAALSSVDVILMPTTPTPAFALGEKVADPLTMYLSDVFTIQANLAGVPAIHVPTAFSPEGLPVGVQLSAAALGESVLLRAARALEAELSLPARPPPLA